MRIAVLHPGRMGAELGRVLVDGGHDVCWLPQGRSSDTRDRAESAGLRAVDSLAGCDLVISICPPAFALQTARSLGAFSGIYLDANAISPQTAAEVAATALAQGADYVDGGVVGPPPFRDGTTRLYLSGPRAAEVAALFASSRAEALVLTTTLFAASALKMSYAGWTKVSAALRLATLQTATELGVESALRAEWARSVPDMADLVEDGRRAAAYGWRWEDEMRQIAQTMSSAGQPGEFGLAAATVYGQYPRPD